MNYWKVSYLVVTLVSQLMAQKQMQMAGSWGSNILGDEGSLSYYCNTGAYDIITLHYLMNFGNGSVTTTVRDCYGVPSPACTALASEISICQQKGIRILLSMGGGAAAGTFNTAENATTTALQVWNLFLGGSDPARPFTKVLDGIDIDSSLPDLTHFDVFVNQLRSHMMAAGDRTYFISASPQCPYDDEAGFRNLISLSHIDFVWVQFYNNPGYSACNIGLAKFGWSLQQWIDLTGPNAGSVFIKTPSLDDSALASNGFVSLQQIVNVTLTFYFQNPDVIGGVFLENAAGNVSLAKSISSFFPVSTQPSSTTLQSTTSSTFTSSSLSSTLSSTFSTFSTTQVIPVDAPVQLENSGNSHLGAIIGGSAAGLVVVIIVIVIAVVFFKRSRKSREISPDSPKSGTDYVPVETAGKGQVQIPLAIKTSGSSSESSFDEFMEIHGNFAIASVVGTGNFGKVYKGSWNGNVVALKSVNELQQAEIHKESRIMRKLNHPNIVRFYGMCLIDEVRYLVMDFASKGDLLKYVKEETSAAENFERWAREIASGMEYLHQQTLLHKDLALRNVLLRFEEDKLVAKVADFGLATEGDYDKLGAEDSSQFAIRWLAPETLMHRKFSKSTDVWAYGVTLWEMYSGGKRPYFAHSNAEAAKLVVAGGTLDPPENCPQHVRGLMAECWTSELTRPDFTKIISRLPV